MIWTQFFHTYLEVLLGKKKRIMQKFSLFCCKMCIFLKKKWQNKIAIIPF